MLPRLILYQTNRQLMKLVHDKLPTNHYNSKRSSTHSGQCQFCSEPETFLHMCTSNCNPQSTEFKTKVALDRWLATQIRDDEPTACTGPQQDSNHVQNVLVKLIHIIWDQMLHLWTSHLQQVHKESSLNKQREIQVLQAEIRQLHSLQDQTMAQHRDMYFHKDLESYLKISTEHQLQRYIDRYRPVIYHSIKRASQLAVHHSQSLTSFFARMAPAPGRQGPTESPREENHRKHTKIRKWSARKITAFFPLLDRPSTA